MLMALLLCQVLAPVESGSAQRVADDFAPGTLAQDIRSQLFSAQVALSRGDAARAASEVQAVASPVRQIAGAFTADPTAGSDLTTAWSAAQTAATSGDAPALASARAAIWTTMLRGAYAETVVAAADGRAGDASRWLLLREFRPTTKFSRPNADATLAVRSLSAGEITPEAAVQAIRADLLDTYQGELALELDALLESTDAGFVELQAETAGLIAGYWSILSPSYAEQAGPEAGAEADAGVARIQTALRSGEPPAVAEAVQAFSDIERSFRAAPLTEDEEARRAGQLVRYLSLIPIEYERGVRDGQVIADIEIQEAQAFHDGARAAFDDLYLDLVRQDPAKAAAVDDSLTWLNEQIGLAAQHTSVAAPGDIESRANGAISTLEGMFPEAWTRDGGSADFDVIQSVLDQMESAVAAGQPDQAESARLEAYAIYELGAEKRLLAFAPELATRTEQLFWGGTGSTPGLATALRNGASTDEVRSIRAELDAALAESQQRLGTGRPATGVVIFNAATIVFREGLEGILILASLVASMVGANRKFKKPLVIGAGLAFVATAVLFWLARTVLQSLSRYGEKLEAIVSLIAIGVLLLVMNWFFHKVYWTRWIAHHHTRRRALIGGAAGQALGLVVLGFTSVFREGAETVLFLQALVLDAGTLVVIYGTVLGLLATAIVGALVLVMQAKLPHKKMLMVTGVMIALVLVVMVGTTTHVLQVVGWLPISPIEGLVVPYWMGVWFGVYSTWQGLLLQVLALVFVIGSYYAAEFKAGKIGSRAGAPSLAPRS
jgi:high-affinity iron transporter